MTKKLIFVSKICWLLHNQQEACDHIRDLETDLDQYLAELKYLYDFVKYRELEEDFRFFRENAHLDSKKDLPFPSYVL